MCGQIRQHIYRDKPVNVWTGVRVDGCEQVLCANVFYLVQCGNKNVQKGDDRSDFFFLKPSLKWFYPSARPRGCAIQNQTTIRGLSGSLGRVSDSLVNSLKLYFEL